MANPETILVERDNSTAVIMAIVIVLLVAFAAYFLLFDRPASPEAVIIDLPQATVAAPTS
jgi:hypothetical protein